MAQLPIDSLTIFCFHIQSGAAVKMHPARSQTHTEQFDPGPSLICSSAWRAPPHLLGAGTTASRKPPWAPKSEPVPLPINNHSHFLTLFCKQALHSICSYKPPCAPCRAFPLPQCQPFLAQWSRRRGRPSVDGKAGAGFIRKQEVWHWRSCLTFRKCVHFRRFCSALGLSGGTGKETSETHALCLPWSQFGRPPYSKALLPFMRSTYPACTMDSSPPWVQMLSLWGGYWQHEWARREAAGFKSHLCCSWAV